MRATEPTYLGDGVHATNGGWHLTLTADHTKTIHLEPDVFASLIRAALMTGWTDPETLQGMVDDAVARYREAKR